MRLCSMFPREGTWVQPDFKHFRWSWHRHPLQELVDDRFVPNDAYAVGGRGLGIQPQTRLSSSSNGNEPNGERDTIEENGCSIVICTGANASGKSVYLKQNALICFMAQVRCVQSPQAHHSDLITDWMVILWNRAKQLANGFEALCQPHRHAWELSTKVIVTFFLIIKAMTPFIVFTRIQTRESVSKVRSQRSSDN